MKKLVSVLIIFIVIVSSLTFAGAADPRVDGTIEGYLRDWVGDQLQIEAYDGSVYLFDYDKKTTLFMIDGRVTDAVDFKPGMEISAKLKGNTIDIIKAFSTEVSGYIQPGSRVRQGVIQKIDRDQLVLKTPAGILETYFTSSATIAQKKGSNVPLSTLYEGDRVRLLFDDPGTAVISRIQIEGDSVVIKDLYKAVLKMADPYENVITLSNVEVYKNGKWQPVKSSMRIPYSGELPAYIGGQKVDDRNLKLYYGKTVYMAVKDFFGTSRIEKMVLKNQYESTYSVKISDINWYTEAFELSNHKNIAFNEGTIIVKNGRLVDPYAMNPQSDALVIADSRSGSSTADIVYIYNEDINNSTIGRNYLYAGRLDEIVQDRVTLKNFFLLNQNDWESYTDSKDLSFDSDTYIYDAGNKKWITAEQLAAGYYSVDENSDYVKEKKLKDWYAYIYTDGDRICSIVVQRSMDTLLRQRATNGVVESITDDSLVGWTVKLINASDWSGQKGKWMQKTASTGVTLENAMIIRDGKIITPEDLNAGDRLYMVRDGFNAKVVIVK